MQTISQFLSDINSRISFSETSSIHLPELNDFTLYERMEIGLPSSSLSADTALNCTNVSICIVVANSAMNGIMAIHFAVRISQKTDITKLANHKYGNAKPKKANIPIRSGLNSVVSDDAPSNKTKAMVINTNIDLKNFLIVSFY